MPACLSGAQASSVRSARERDERESGCERTREAAAAWKRERERARVRGGRGDPRTEKEREIQRWRHACAR